MNISQSVRKKDHRAKIDGSAKYVEDLNIDGMLQARVLRSKYARAKILNIKTPSLPEGYFIVDKNDVPGINEVHMVEDDTPVFADGIVEFIGDPILMVVGPDLKIVDELLNKIVVDYEVLTPVLDPEKSDTAFFEYDFGKGDVEEAFSKADKVYTETFRTGYQEQAYLEVQGMIGDYHDGKVTVRGSMQCPYYVHGAVAKAMGLEARKVQIIQDVTGGGFGGKEDYPSLLGCQLAVASHKAKKTC